LTYIPENELEKGKEREDVKKWNSDFIELMEYTKNSNYGETKCLHCLLNPAGDDPIFIGINRLVAKGLVSGKHDPPQYPCEVVNRFQCPCEVVKRAMNSAFDVIDLFKLEDTESQETDTNTDNETNEEQQQTSEPTSPTIAVGEPNPRYPIDPCDLPNDGRPQPSKGANIDPQTWNSLQNNY
jgi:hypothetical protein